MGAVTPTETKRVYEQACRTKRETPQDDQGRAWHRVLRGYDVRDVQAALDGWWADTTPTHSGRPRGAFMPEPAELKPLVEAARRRRETKEQTPKDLVRWRCQGCKCTCCGYVDAGSIRPPKCTKCGISMDETDRERV